MSQDIPKLEPPKTPNISKCKPKVRSRSRSLSEHSHQSPQKLPSRPSSRSKSRIKKQESFSSRSPSPIKESSEQNGSLPVSKNSLTEQMKSVLKTPRKVSTTRETDTNKKTRQVTEEEKPISVLTAVEDTMESIFQQVDKAMVDSAKKQDDNGIIEKTDEEVVEPPGSTIRVQSTRSSKLRKKSARSRLEMYKNLPPGRQEEYQAYAGKSQSRGIKQTKKDQKWNEH